MAEKFDINKADFTYRPKAEDTGNLNQEQNDDLPTNTGQLPQSDGASLETLAHYLSNLTYGIAGQHPLVNPRHPNAFPIHPAHNQAPSLDGSTPTNIPPTNNGVSSFWNILTPDQQAHLARYSTGEYFENIPKFLNKSSQNTGKESGHSLLTSIKTTSEPGDVIDQKVNLASIEGVKSLIDDPV